MGEVDFAWKQTDSTTYWSLWAQTMDPKMVQESCLFCVLLFCTMTIKTFSWIRFCWHLIVLFWHITDQQHDMAAQFKNCSIFTMTFCVTLYTMQRTSRVLCVSNELDSEIRGAYSFIYLLKFILFWIKMIKSEMIPKLLCCWFIAPGCPVNFKATTISDFLIKWYIFGFRRQGFFQTLHILYTILSGDRQRWGYK